jgi:hypothetical protein
MDIVSSRDIGLGVRVRCGRGINGVIAGDGIGVGISLIGERHLLLIPLEGISKRIVGGCKRLGVVLCALI